MKLKSTIICIDCEELFEFTDRNYSCPICCSKACWPLGTVIHPVGEETVKKVKLKVETETKAVEKEELGRIIS